jgi:hypothetical protein
MEINIRKAAAHCLACGKRFEHLQKHFSQVSAPTDQELLREDYCPECWESGRAADAERALSFWLAKYYDPAAASQPDERTFGPLRTVFYEAVESDQRLEQAIAYIAAHLLRRQKAFRFVKGFEDTESECQVSVFYDKLSGRMTEVVDQEFSVEELQAARQEFTQRLERMEGSQDDSRG